MAFTLKQRKSLETAPPSDAIKTREENGTILSYLEGWYVIQQANHIFGPEHWDRVTLTAQIVWQGRYDGKPACTYTARVRLCIRTKDETIVREGSGVGHGLGAHLGEAHGQALKAAETDATKRALATLGTPFGLTLYDSLPRTKARSEANGKPASESAAKPTNSHAQARPVAPWIVRSANGEAIGAYSSPVLGCSSLRRAIDQTTDPAVLEGLYANNRRFLARLSLQKPNLRDTGERHYSEILTALYQTKLKRLSDASGNRAPAPVNGNNPVRLSDRIPAD
ncbi:Rad52/Rad22 family DNA repair protein [Parvibaculum sp.]|uniref:Rad52/Rad22 family DNA repair protein n=1 Tax=Parvibaculum sp. TaxID=2024848 RepID=UPI003299FCD0